MEQNLGCKESTKFQADWRLPMFMKCQNNKSNIFSWRKTRLPFRAWGKSDWNQIYHEWNWMGWDGWRMKDNGVINIAKFLRKVILKLGFYIWPNHHLNVKTIIFRFPVTQSLVSLYPFLKKLQVYLVSLCFIFYSAFQILYFLQIESV